MRPEDVIRIKIEESGIKQSFVADKACISRDKLSRSLNNKRRLKPDELVSVCLTLGIKIEDFDCAS